MAREQMNNEQQQQQQQQQQHLLKYSDPIVLQNQINDWAEANFGVTPTEAFSSDRLLLILESMRLIGVMAHCELKRAQGIRGDAQTHIANFEEAALTLSALLTSDDGVYASQTNKYTHHNLKSWKLQSLLGMVEELGEIITAITDHDHNAVVDGIGDLQVYLNNFSGQNHMYAYLALVDTWVKVVSKRNWRENPLTGVATAPAITEGEL